MSKRYVGATEVAYTVADLLACLEALTRGLGSLRFYLD
jgi:hypothetical protein